MQSYIRPNNVFEELLFCNISFKFYAITKLIKQLMKQYELYVIIKIHKDNHELILLQIQSIKHPYSMQLKRTPAFLQLSKTHEKLGQFPS